MAATVQARAKDKATKLHSVLVRARGRCERCGSAQNLQCAHIVRRNYAHTRTDLENAWCLCAKCHWETEKWANEFMALVGVTVGNDKFELLRRKAKDGVGVKFDWVAELARLQQLEHAQ